MGLPVCVAPGRRPICAVRTVAHSVRVTDALLCPSVGSHSGGLALDRRRLQHAAILRPPGLHGLGSELASRTLGSWAPEPPRARHLNAPSRERLPAQQIPAFGRLLAASCSTTSRTPRVQCLIPSSSSGTYDRGRELGAHDPGYDACLSPARGDLAPAAPPKLEGRPGMPLPALGDTMPP